jgi:L-alanine-DL-glutamate epimerase-like enolase superfamily enzyme
MASAGSPSEVLQEVVAAHERGFEWFKLKVGDDVDEAVTLTRAVRESLPAAHVYVDPNQQLRGHAYVDFVRACRDLNLAFMEEPLPWRNNPAREALFAQAGLPVLADESVETLGCAIPQIESGPAQLISLKPPRLGVTATRFLAELAAHHQKQPWIGSHAETDLGALACAHLVGGFQAFTGPSELAFYQTLAGSLLAEPIDRGGAVIHLGEEPGLGLDLDEAALERWCVSRRTTHAGLGTEVA